eukprot:3179854-Rhodomonas_salina.2
MLFRGAAPGAGRAPRALRVHRQVPGQDRPPARNPTQETTFSVQFRTRNVVSSMQSCIVLRICIPMSAADLECARTSYPMSGRACAVLTLGACWPAMSDADIQRRGH